LAYCFPKETPLPRDEQRLHEKAIRSQVERGAAKVYVSFLNSKQNSKKSSGLPSPHRLGQNIYENDEDDGILTAEQKLADASESAGRRTARATAGKPTAAVTPSTEPKYVTQVASTQPAEGEGTERYDMKDNSTTDRRAPQQCTT
jgi:hypothetical protein